jgi:RecJ-like exonuclease
MFDTNEEDCPYCMGTGIGMTFESHCATCKGLGYIQYIDDLFDDDEPYDICEIKEKKDG